MKGFGYLFLVRERWGFFVELDIIKEDKVCVGLGVILGGLDKVSEKLLRFLRGVV